MPLSLITWICYIFSKMGKSGLWILPHPTKQDNPPVFFLPLVGEVKMEPGPHSRIKLRLLLLLSWFSCVRLCATSQTAAHQAPPSLGFSRQEHWSGLPFPSPMHESEKWKWNRSVVSGKINFLIMKLFTEGVRLWCSFLWSGRGN